MNNIRIITSQIKYNIGTNKSQVPTMLLLKIFIVNTKLFLLVLIYIIHHSYNTPTGQSLVPTVY